MGLLPKAELAWLSVDDKLYLWPYTAPVTKEGPSFCSFKTPTGQCIISVALVNPKAGVFKSSVKWCLVVTTPDEVILLALAPLEGSAAIRLVPTHFSVPTDDVRMLSVCGTTAGRIFLGGEDGCLYEMTYEGINAGSSSLSGGG